MPEPQPLVSVVIPAYNAENFIVGAVESVLKQTYTHTEIIVIDDGSTDETEKRLEPYRDRIQYLKQNNSGVSVARNSGILHAHGDYIAFLDADDIWLDTKLTEQLSYFERYPQTVVTYTDYARGPLPEILDYSVLRHNPEKGSGKVFERLIRRNFVGMSTAIVRRDVFSTVGLFDPTLSGVEDYDMWVRVSEVGEYGFVDKVLVHYRQGVSGLSTTLRFEYDRIRLGKLFLNRYGDQPGVLNDIRKNLAEWYSGLAYREQSAGKYREARRLYWQSLRYGGSLRTAVPRIAAFSLPNPVLKVMFSLRRRFTQSRTPVSCSGKNLVVEKGHQL